MSVCSPCRPVLFGGGLEAAAVACVHPMHPLDWRLMDPPPEKTKCHVTGTLKVSAAMQRLIYQGKVLKEEERDLASFGGAF